MNICLGIDNARTGPTGLCLISYKDTQPGTAYGNDWQLLRAASVKTPDYPAMIEAITTFCGLDIPTVCCAEWGYISVKREDPNSLAALAFGDDRRGKLDKGVVGGFTAVETAIWVRCALYHHFRLTRYYRASAYQWREKVWGHGKGWMPREQAKEYSIDIARKAGIENPDDHQGDALGLAIYGMRTDLEATDNG